MGAFFFHSFGAYVVLLTEQFGWSKTALAAAFSLQRVQAAVLAPLQGWLLERYGPRLVMQIGIVLWGIGFILLSQIEPLDVIGIPVRILGGGGASRTLHHRHPFFHSVVSALGCL